MATIIRKFVALRSYKKQFQDLWKSSCFSSIYVGGPQELLLVFQVNRGGLATKPHFLGSILLEFPWLQREEYFPNN